MKLSIWELPFRSIPESMIFVFAIYVFSFTKLDTKKWLLPSLIMSVVTFVVRLLPIQPGVHTFILIIFHVIVAVLVSKMDILKAISSTLIAIILLFTCELLNIVTLLKVFKVQPEELENPIKKLMYGIPNLLVFGLIVYMVYKRSAKKRNVSNVPF